MNTFTPYGCFSEDTDFYVKGPKVRLRLSDETTATSVAQALNDAYVSGVRDTQSWVRQSLGFNQ